MRTGPVPAEMKAAARQEEWYLYAIAAEALGGSAWELARLPEPDRTFWLKRGLLKNAAAVEAMQEDETDRVLGGRI